MSRLLVALLLLITTLSLNATTDSGAVTALKNQPSLTINRLLDAPIIDSSLHQTLGDNIQGPSLIRVPKWIDNPLGNYYLYFADHKGSYIRLAYADELTGPWTVYEPGSLQLSQSKFLTQPPASTPEMLAQARQRIKDTPYPHDIVLDLTTPHIASPDVHVDNENKRLVMYFHGLNSFAVQVSRVAESTDGINFVAHDQIVGRPYMRTFKHGGFTYAMSMPGQFYRSSNGIDQFETGPMLFERNMRHAALLVRDKNLMVFWTRVGDTPERILLSTIDISEPWETWSESEAIEVLRPEKVWEGADAPLMPSMRSVAYGNVNQLRDPAIFVEDNRVYLLYAVAGEAGIAMVELILSE
ncbi:MAG: hypothetical protein ABGY96_12750 [bacterium]